MRRIAVQSTVLSLALLACSAPLYADVTVVSTVQTKQVVDGKTKASAQTYTLSVKGRKARRESDNGTVVLIDRDTNQVYTLDPKSKTFWVVGIRETMDRGSRLPNEVAGFLSLNSDVDLRQGKEDGTDPWRDIHGFSTKILTLNATASLSPRMPDGPGISNLANGQGGFPGGGSLPVGGPPNGRFPRGNQPTNGSFSQTEPLPPLPEMRAMGEIYVTDAATLLGVEKRDALELTYALVQTLFPEDSPLTKVFSNRLGRRAPLAGTITMLMPATPDPTTPTEASKATDGTSKDVPSGQQRSPETKMQTLTMMLATELVNDDTSLDDSLFVVPEGYTQIAPPAPKLAFTLPPMRGRQTARGNGTVFAGDTP